MTTHAPLTLSLTGRPLLLYPAIVPELSARLQEAMDSRAARLGERARRLSWRRRARADNSPLAFEPAGHLPPALLAPSATVDVGGGHLAVIAIDGPLLNKAWVMQTDEGPVLCMDGYDRIEGAVAAAAADPDCRGILLAIDSPGGHVNGCFECADAIHALAAQIPIVAHTDGLMASAAYAIASAASRVTGTLTSMIGSVGVIYGRLDQSEAEARAGLRIRLYTSGSQKAWGSPHLALSDEEDAATQAEIEHLATLFHDRVARTRPLDAAGVAALEAGVFLADAAVANGLADARESRADALLALAALATAPAPAPDPAPPDPKPTPVATQETLMRNPTLARLALASALVPLAFSMAAAADAGSRFAHADIYAAVRMEAEEEVDAMEDEDVAAMDDLEDPDGAALLDEEDSEASEDDPDTSAKAASRIARRALARLEGGTPAASVPASPPATPPAPAAASVGEQILALPESATQPALAARLALSGLGLDAARGCLAAAAADGRNSRAARRPVPSPVVGASAGGPGATTPAQAALDAVNADLRKKTGAA